MIVKLELQLPESPKTAKGVNQHMKEAKQQEAEKRVLTDNRIFTRWYLWDCDLDCPLCKEETTSELVAYRTGQAEMYASNATTTY